MPLVSPLKEYWVSLVLVDKITTPAVVNCTLYNTEDELDHDTAMTVALIKSTIILLIDGVSAKHTHFYMN